MRLLVILLSLGFIGCGAGEVDQLLTDLQSQDATVRRAAARRLGELESSEPDVVAALHSSLSDPDRDVRRLVCAALGKSDAADVESLARALNDEEASVRLAAAYAVQKHRSDHAGAMKVLSAAMRAGDGGVIVQVTSGGAEAAWAVPTLTKLLSDKRPGIRRLAAEGLGAIGAASKESLGELRRAAKDVDDRVRDAAADAIARIEGSE